MIKKSLGFFLFFALLSKITIAQTAQEYWEQYGNKPIIVEQNNGGSKQNLKFIKFDNGMLVAELDGGTAEISLPVSESLVSTLNYKIPKIKLIRGFIKQENYEEALKLMRPQIYPLVKFHEVPGSFKKIHDPIRMLLRTLVLGEQYDEAEFLLSKIQLEKVDIQYSRFAGNLIEVYIDQQELDGATRIANSLPIDGIYVENIAKLVDLADSLRAASKYRTVIPIYEAILPVVPEETQVSMKMWLAYCLTLDGQEEKGTKIFEELDEPELNNIYFSLYKLLEGSRLYRSNQYDQALDVLTRGFVRARTSYDWIPEMLFLIGDCYARANDNGAAGNVWEEVATLYPSSPWAERAQESLNKLPKPSQPTEEPS
ncbi:MAG: hypothetical protein AAGH40_13510 [Verrucomicrobiota bacterium]